MRNLITFLALSMLATVGMAGHEVEHDVASSQSAHVVANVGAAINTGMGADEVTAEVLNSVNTLDMTVRTVGADVDPDVSASQRAGLVLNAGVASNTHLSGDDITTDVVNSVNTASVTSRTDGFGADSDVYVAQSAYGVANLGAAISANLGGNDIDTSVLNSVNTADVTSRVRAGGLGDTSAVGVTQRASGVVQGGLSVTAGVAADDVATSVTNAVNTSSITSTLRSGPPVSGPPAQ